MHVYKLEFKNRSDIGTNYVPPAFVAVFALQLILWYKVYYMHSFSDAWSASYTTVHPKRGQKTKGSLHFQLTSLAATYSSSPIFALLGLRI